MILCTLNSFLVGKNGAEQREAASISLWAPVRELPSHATKGKRIPRSIKIRQCRAKKTDLCIRLPVFFFFLQENFELLLKTSRVKFSLSWRSRGIIPVPSPVVWRSCYQHLHLKVLIAAQAKPKTSWDFCLLWQTLALCGNNNLGLGPKAGVF